MTGSSGPTFHPDYKVQLEAFEGPLDLLLYLIRKDEVDIHNIPIAHITEQYLAYLSQLRLASSLGGARVDIETAGEFLVMAASLMEIKSRMLMPNRGRPEQSGGEASANDRAPVDPRAELVRQLLEYKKYRDAADALENKAESWRRRFPAAKLGVDKDALAQAVEAASEQSIDVGDIDILDLLEAFRKVAESVNFDRLGDHQVQYDDTPIELHAADIVDRLKRLPEELRRAAEAAGEVSADLRTDLRAELRFVSLFENRTRTEVLGLFLALLELCRQRQVAFRHDEAGEVQIRLRTEEEIKEDRMMRGAGGGPGGGGVGESENEVSGEVAPSFGVSGMNPDAVKNDADR